MDPEELADAYVRKAHALASARRHDEALELYDAALGIDPGCVEAWTGKAVALKALGRWREALACLERALEIGPSPIAERLLDGVIEELRRRGELR